LRWRGVLLWRSAREGVHVIRGIVGGLGVGAVGIGGIHVRWLAGMVIALAASLAGGVTSVVSKAEGRGEQWHLEDN
jgi:hypothetical protein